jgi:hypothetical protein
MHRGVVYACSHPDWLRETCTSAKSFKDVMPELERELYIPAAWTPKDSAGLFTRIVPLQNVTYKHRPRYEAMLQTQLDQAIFMDSDTYFVLPVPELFDALEIADMAIAHDVQYLHTKGVELGIYDLLPKVSLAVPEWNCGVMCVRVNDTFRSFVKDWHRWFDVCREHGYHMDQAAFRSTLANSRLRIAPLANNFNLRAQFPHFVIGAIRILHAHGDLAAIAQTINRRLGRRQYVPNPTLIHGKQPKDYLTRKLAKQP